MCGHYQHIHTHKHIVTHTAGQPAACRSWQYIWQDHVNTSSHIDSPLTHKVSQYTHTHTHLQAACSCTQLSSTLMLALSTCSSLSSLLISLCLRNSFLLRGETGGWTALSLPVGEVSLPMEPISWVGLPGLTTVLCFLVLDTLSRLSVGGVSS